MSRSIISARAPEPVGPYPHAKQVGKWIFVSGIGPRTRGSAQIPGVTLDAQGNVAAHDIALQCRSVFDNLRTILEDAGAELENVVDMTVFLTHLKDDFTIYNRVYAEYFPTQRPARTTVEVTALPTPIAIEVKAIAVLGD